MNETRSFKKRIFDFVVEIQSVLLKHSAILNSLEDYTGSTESETRFRLEYLNADDYLDYKSKIQEHAGYFGYFNDTFYIWIDDVITRIKFCEKEIILGIPDFKKDCRIPEVLSESAVMIFLRGRGYFPLHASGGRYKSNVLFAGKSGCGKSTLVYLMDKIGGTAYSDDRIFILQDSGKFGCRSLNNTIQLWDDKPQSGEKKLYFPAVNRKKITSEWFIPDKIFFPVFYSEEYPRRVEIKRVEAVMRLIPLTLPLRYKNDLLLIKEFASDCSFYILNLPEKSLQIEATMELLRKNC